MNLLLTNKTFSSTDSLLFLFYTNLRHKIMDLNHSIIIIEKRKSDLVQSKSGTCIALQTTLVCRSKELEVVVFPPYARLWISMKLPTTFTLLLRTLNNLFQKRFLAPFWWVLLLFFVVFGRGGGHTGSSTSTRHAAEGENTLLYLCSRGEYSHLLYERTNVPLLPCLYRVMY